MKINLQANFILFYQEFANYAVIYEAMVILIFWKRFVLFYIVCVCVCVQHVRALSPDPVVCKHMKEMK